MTPKQSEPAVLADELEQCELAPWPHSLSDYHVVLVDEALRTRILSALRVEAQIAASQAFARRDSERRAALRAPSPTTWEDAERLRETREQLRNLVAWLEEDADNIHLLPPELVKRTRALIEQQGTQGERT